MEFPPFVFKTELVSPNLCPCFKCLHVSAYIHLSGWRCNYIYFVSMCVHYINVCVYTMLMCVPIWNTCSVLVLAGPEAWNCSSLTSLGLPNSAAPSIRLTCLIYSSSR